MSRLSVAGAGVSRFGRFKGARELLFRPVGDLSALDRFPTAHALGFILSPLRGYERPGALADGFVMFDEFFILLEC
jgi:hypothetical protein